MPDTHTIELTLDSHGNLVATPETQDANTNDSIIWHIQKNENIRLFRIKERFLGRHHPFTIDLDPNLGTEIRLKVRNDIRSKYTWNYKIDFTKNSSSTIQTLDPKITVRPGNQFTATFFIISLVALVALVTIGNYFNIFKLNKSFKINQKLNDK